MYFANTFSATIVQNATSWASLSALASAFNNHKSVEKRNAEKRIKVWNSRNVQTRPGTREKHFGKDFAKPYLEPRKVPLAEKAKACWGKNWLWELGKLALYLRYKGCLRFEKSTGCNNKGSPTV